MSGQDEELQRLREGVNCAALLERMPPPWRLDKAESTRDCLKYRRGQGEIIIVNHGGHGWWDAGSTAKGDVFGLVQHLRPDLNFGHARKLLANLDHLVVQDLFLTKTAELADVVLPSAAAWCEDDGTVTENYWEPVPDDEDFVAAEGTMKPYRIEIVGVVCDAYLAVARGIRYIINYLIFKVEFGVAL